MFNFSVDMYVFKSQVTLQRSPKICVRVRNTGTHARRVHIPTDWPVSQGSKFEQLYTGRKKSWSRDRTSWPREIRARTTSKSKREESWRKKREMHGEEDEVRRGTGGGGGGG